MKKKLLKSVLIFTCVLFLAGCGKKEAITNKEFKKAMENNKYTNYDITEQYKEFGNVVDATAALNDDKTIQIEFYDLESEESAIGMYNTNKDLFEKSKGSASIETNVSLSNYAKYTLDSNNKYMVVSRIDNTLIYISVKSKFKDEVKKILKDINY